MGVYDRQVAAAKRLITQKGQSVTWRAVRDGAAADPAEPWKPGASDTTDHTVDVVFLPQDRRNMEFLSMLAGTEIPKGNVIGYMGGVNFVPSLKDTVVRDGETYGISYLDHISPNGESILWIVGFDR